LEGTISWNFSTKKELVLLFGSYQILRNCQEILNYLKIELPKEPPTKFWWGAKLKETKEIIKELKSILKKYWRCFK